MTERTNLTDETHRQTADRGPSFGSDRRRRTFLKGIGAAATLATVPGLAGATTAADEPGGVDESFDLSDPDAAHEALVVFRSNEDVDRLGTLDLVDGYLKFRVLPIGYVTLTSEQIRAVAEWTTAEGVYPNEELEWHNDGARETTGAEAVQNGDGLDASYTGESVHAAVIDTGVDGDHPDLDANLREHWQFVGVPEAQDEPVMWTRAGDLDTDENGHGTHTSGSVAGDGAMSDGKYRGMAPDADLTVYAIGATLLLVYVVSAWDHLLDRKRRGEADVQVVSNSYGPIEDGKDFDPYQPVNVAAWYAYSEGIVPCFSAGNSGPGEQTLSQYAKAPYSLGVAATRDDRVVTDFSSRGRPRDFDGPSNWDRETALRNVEEIYDYESATEPSGPYGVYRNDVGAPGNFVMSTLSPADALQAYAAGTDEQDARLWYGRLSGTSMSCPVTAGCTALVIDAYQQSFGEAPAPVDVINTVEATAKEYHDTYTPVNIGTGFVDVRAAAARAEAGDWATFEEARASVVRD